MYELNNDFSNTRISRHYTIEAAARAAVKHDRAVKRNAGENAYIPLSVTRNGNSITESEQNDFANERAAAIYRGRKFTGSIRSPQKNRKQRSSQ